MQQVQRLSNREQITLGAEIARGGEGAVFEIVGDLSIVAKIYHANKMPPDQVDKLKAMVANPPDDPMRKQGKASIAWCIDLLTPIGGGQPVGFLMPRVSEMYPIFDFYTPINRVQQAPLFNYAYLHRAARNLAVAMRSIHSSGYVIGDVNESNILVSETALVTLVDVDSFQVRDGNTIYRCIVGKPEFTPPELQGKSFRNTDRSSEHDVFGLAVIIFRLLMEGNHPFDGVFTGQGEVPSLEARIKAGHFPYATQKVPYRPRPLAPSINVLHPALQQLFQRCFEAGHLQPSVRPNAGEWQAALDEAEKSLKTCSKNKQHTYGNHLNDCPWCDRTKLLGGRDPFPSVQAVSQGKNLKTSPGVQTPLPLLPKLGIRPAALPRVKLPPLISRLLTGVFNAVAKKAAPIKVPLIAGISLAAVTQGYGYSQYRLFPSNPFEVIDSKLALVKTLEYKKLKPRNSSSSPQANTVIFSPDGQKVAIQSEDNGPRYIWDLQGNQVKELPYDGLPLGSFSQDSQSINTFEPRHMDEIISGVYNVNTGKEIAKLSINGKDHHAIAFSPNQQIFLEILSQDSTGTIYGIFNRQGAEISRFPAAIQQGSHAASFSADGNTVAICSGREETTVVTILSIKTNQIVASLSGDKIFCSFESDHNYGPILLSDGKTLVTRSRDEGVIFWNWETKQKIRTIEVDSSRNYIALSPDGNTLATASRSDRRIKIWDWRSGKVIHTFYLPIDDIPAKKEDRSSTRSLRSLSFSADGSTIASATGDGPVRVWKIR
jgi:serine/threonine protein kinase